MRTLSNLLLVIISLFSYSCGGGSSDSGMLIEGTLSEAGSAAHENFLIKHSAGEKIENVKICALGECSTTDAQGQWGFIAPDSFTGGDAALTINGHGIDTSIVIEIPEGSMEVVLDLQHEENGSVKAEHITIDGDTTHNEDSTHSHD